MAENITLRMTFKGVADKKISISLPYADESKGAAVKPLMEAIVANKDIFEDKPLSLSKAEFVKTETNITPVDLS